MFLTENSKMQKWSNAAGIVPQVLTAVMGRLLATPLVDIALFEGDLRDTAGGEGRHPRSVCLTRWEAESTTNTLKPVTK